MFPVNSHWGVRLAKGRYDEVRGRYSLPVALVRSVESEGVSVLNHACMGQSSAMVCGIWPAARIFRGGPCSNSAYRCDLPLGGSSPRPDGGASAEHSSIHYRCQLEAFSGRPPRGAGPGRSVTPPPLDARRYLPLSRDFNAAAVEPTWRCAAYLPLAGTVDIAVRDVAQR
jgi:hypothetical protein